MVRCPLCSLLPFVNSGLPTEHSYKVKDLEFATEFLRFKNKLPTAKYNHAELCRHDYF